MPSGYELGTAVTIADMRIDQGNCVRCTVHDWRHGYPLCLPDCQPDFVRAEKRSWLLQGEPPEAASRLGAVPSGLCRSCMARAFLLYVEN